MIHRVTLVTTRRESMIRSNTGRLLVLRLSNLRTIFLGCAGWEEEVDEEKHNPGYTPLVLFPTQGHETAAGLHARLGKPLNIFVFDTNWGTARKWMAKKSFIDLPRVQLQDSHVSRYALRVSPDPGYLCTCQALASLLSESGPELQPVASDLMSTLDHVVTCMARERGELVRNRHVR